MKLDFFKSINLIKYHFHLLNIKIVDFRSLKWFFLSVITISTLFTISSSFLLGFQNQSLFVENSANNILVITQPSITPAQSHIPLFWVEDIQQLKGISVISPETIDLVIDRSHSQTPYFRGITSNYKDLFPFFSMNQGVFFDTTNTTSNEVIVGSTYASLFHIHVGDHLILQSRIENIILDVSVSGIFLTNTISDNGILGPLWMGRLFTGLTNDIVNLIQIKFDPTLYTKSELQSIILGTHQLSIKVTNPYNYNLDISKSTVELYNRYKQKINQSLVDSNNMVFFNIPFGKYYLQVTNPNSSNNAFDSVFVTNNSTVNLILGTQYAVFSAQFSISNEPKENASVSILNQDTDQQFNYTTNNTGEINTNLPLGTLFITFNWKNYQNTTLVNHQTSENLSINFEYQIKFIFRDSATNSSLSGKSLLILDHDTNSSLTVLTNKNGIITTDLQPSTSYTVISSNLNYTRTWLFYSLNDTSINLFAGYLEATVQLRDVDVGMLINQPVTITLKDALTNFTQSIINTTTNNEGVVQFSAMSGTIISIATTYGSSQELFENNFTMENNRSILLYVGKQEFFIQINNGEFSSDNLFPLKVAFQNLNTIDTINIVLNSNQTYKLFLNYGNYSISATNNKVSFFNEIHFNLTSLNQIVINFIQYIGNFSFFTKSGTPFIGNFELLENIQSQYVSIAKYFSSNFVVKLENGMYRILLHDSNYFFSTDFSINNQNRDNSYYVSENYPSIQGNNFANFSIINSSQILYISFKNSVSVQYKWTGNIFQNYDSLTGISPPLNEGTYNLTIIVKNLDNVQVNVVYSITIDNTGPIITLLNNHGNNSYVNYNLLPIFKFSKPLKSVQYIWNTTNVITDIPINLPSSNGWNKLTVIAQDFALNTKMVSYNFYYDNVAPQVINVNTLNNSIIYSNSLSINFSEPLFHYSYYWSTNMQGGVYTPSTYFNTHIPVPSKDGTNLSLTISFQDLAGNKNSVHLIFPYLDQYSPRFELNGTYNNEVFNQINDSQIYFSTYDTNNTVFYRWNQSASWNIIQTMLYTNYSIQVPYTNGNLSLEVKVYDTFNSNNFFNATYNFYGNFTSPQFNISLTEPIGPSQPIKIIFPLSVQNWTILWNDVINQTGTSSYAQIMSPNVLGNQQLSILFFYSDNSSNLKNYTFNIANAIPALVNKNITILSTLQSYILTFPSYVNFWNYTWDNINYYSGIGNTALKFSENYTSDIHYLYINYTTIYGQYSNFTLLFIFDSIPPSIVLSNGKNFSPQQSGFVPKFTYSEAIRQILYSWDGAVNSTYLFGMPRTQDKALHNLTIYFEDFAFNWNTSIFSFYQDNTPITISLDPNNATINNNFVKFGQTIVFNTSELPALTTCSWNDQSPYICSLTVPIINFQGQITFVIRVYDAAGNGNSYSLILKTDTIPPVLISSDLTNYTIINHDFAFNYSFSEPVSAVNSIYSWDSFNNVTGFPVINATLIGQHILHWWFSDNQLNWNYYAFYVSIYTSPPTVSIVGNYSNTVISANSSLILVLPSKNAYPLDVYTQWNSGQLQHTNINAGLNVPIILPNNLGNNSLLIMIKDNYNNWFNQSYSFTIRPILSVTLTDQSNQPLNANFLLLINQQTNNPIFISNNSNRLSTFVDPGTYKLIVGYQNYNLTSILNLQSTSIYKTIVLKKITIDFGNNSLNQTLSGTIQWQDNSFTSTALNINGSTTMYSSTSKTEFKAIIGPNIFQRSLDMSQNIEIVNFTLHSIKLTYQVITSLNHIPVANALLYANQTLLGITDADGQYSTMIRPGSYSITIFYSNFSYISSIEIFENQNLTISMPIYSNITIVVLNNDLSAAEYISVKLYSLGSVSPMYGLTDFNGQITWNFIPWGNYEIEILTNTSSYMYNITVSNSAILKNNIFSFTIPTSTILTLTGTNNLGKWSFNRDYQISSPSELSDTTLNNLGFSVIFPTLFLIILIMTIFGLISVLHQPIYRLQYTVKNLKTIGSSNEQILEIISLQFGILSLVLSLIGYCFGFLVIIYWPAVQQLPIAGMIIKPEIGDAFIPLVIGISFGHITMIYAHRYANRPNFSKKKRRYF